MSESDRRAATERLVRELGGRSRRTRQGLEIVGTAQHPGFELEGERDHRVVMSAAVGAFSATTPSRIGEADAVRKSFPGFWRALASLRAGGAVR